MDQEYEALDTHETPEGPSADETPSASEGQEADVTPEGAGPAATEGAEGEEAGRPREVIRGIHPELKCECPECAPEYTELQWFSPEEERKVKGTVMLYCQRSSRKYFSPAPEFQAWLAENVEKGGKRRRKDG